MNFMYIYTPGIVYTALWLDDTMYNYKKHKYIQYMKFRDGWFEFPTKVVCSGHQR